ncbi:MAG: monovalent cation:proton antiporter-2 (CPA2) family protein [Burkholderiaceae bacterium]
MQSYLADAFIYLLAAVIAVPLAKRLGLGSVLGYLIAGVLIGPVLNLVGDETESLQHFAEFGVVMMLFLVGLEVEPRLLWKMRNQLFGLGGLQVGLSATVLMGVSLLAGLPWETSLAVGLIFSLSSTAIVLQTLAEKRLATTQGGRSSFAVLLLQDIAVIPMLAFIPLLALPAISGDLTGAIATQPHDNAQPDLIAGLPGWGYALVVLGSVALVVLGGQYLTRPIFRFIASAHLREIFTAAALLFVIGIALLMGQVGLSPALGTFLAGVVLANSEYRHELESDIEPFKGLLLGLFFMTVGAGIDFVVLAEQFWLVVGLTLAVIVSKALVLLVLGWLFGIRGSQGLLLALGLAQAGEFCFVLLSFSVQNQVIPVELSKTLSLVVALSMLLSPLLFIAYQSLSNRMDDKHNAEAEEVTEKGSVLIAGHGRFGQIINRMLIANGHKTVVLDHRAELVDGMRRFDVQSFYGDASRPDLLMAAGLNEISTLVVAIDDQEHSVSIVEYARRERPDLQIIARAFDRPHVYRLYRAGANEIVRETFDSAVRAGKYAMISLGEHPFRVEKSARRFFNHDRETVAALARLWDPEVSVFDNQSYVELARERTRMMYEMMESIDDTSHSSSDRAWAPPPRKTDTPAGESKN